MIKVYLQYPWKFPDSPYYKYLIENPPKNIEFVNAENQKGVITSGKKFKFMNKIKNIARLALNFLKRPNIVKTKKGNYNLIHCAHCLSKNKIPWIVDVEEYWNFSSGGDIAYSKKGKDKIKKFLKNPYCKKIIPWTNAAKESIIKNLQDKEIEKKIEVIYPAIPIQKFIKKKNRKITLLFVGRYFYGKGGLNVIEVFDELSKKYNIECKFVSETPKEIKNKYSSNSKIKFYDLMPQKELFKLFEESDIFVYPGYSDTFGFALIEAMSFGLPIVTAEGFARNEIVEEGKTGYIIKTGKIIWKKIKIDKENYWTPIITNEKELISNFCKKILELIKNPEKMKIISQNCIKEIKLGKFSIKERNKKLEKIYNEAMNNN